MDSDWVEALIRLIEGILFISKNILREYYVRPYFIIIDYVLPFIYFCYLKKKHRFELQYGYRCIMLQSVVYGFFIFILAIPIIMVIVGILSHCVSFFLRFFIPCNPYYIPRLLHSLYCQNIFPIYFTIIFIVNIALIRDDLFRFKKGNGKYRS